MLMKKILRMSSFLALTYLARNSQFELFHVKRMNSHAHDASWFITIPNLLAAKALKQSVKIALNS